MSDKNEKDSYARDTLAFSVPKEAVRKNNIQTQGRPPQGKYPERNQQYSAQYPQDKYLGEQYSQGQIPYGQQPYDPNGQVQRPQGQRPHNPNGQVQRPQGQQPRNPNGQVQRPQRQQPHNPNGQVQRPHGQQPRNPNGQVQRPQGQRPHNANGQGQRPQGQRPRNPDPQRQKKRNASKVPQQKAPKNPKRKKGGLTKILLSALSILVFAFIVYSIVVIMVISKVNVNDRGERISPSHSLYDSSNVRNILLIGNDSRDGDLGRSDSMILLSINSSTNKINIISLMRDMYVDIPEYGKNKLNAAYSYGGPELLMDTIEENFYIEVDDYISVNFTSFAGIVDAIGGVEIEINEDEAAAINVLLDSKEGVSLFGTPDESDYLYGAGKYKLNGKQALCYARLRKVGNADFERTERQRKVLTGMFKNMGASSVFSIIGDAFPDVSTNMSVLQMYWLSLRLPFVLGFYDVEQLRIPAENTFWDSVIDGQDVLEIDFDTNLNIIEKDIYGN